LGAADSQDFGRVLFGCAGRKTHSQKRADAVEQRISDLHTQLKITDAQSKQWDAFAQTMRDNAMKTSQAFHDRRRSFRR
jgi:Domain of Unknown Function (DUF1520).